MDGHLGSKAKPSYGSVVRSIHYCFVRNVNPFAINAHVIVTVLAFPIDIVNALRIAAIATRPLAAVQALIPAIQLGVLMIVSVTILWTSAA